jgi:hypothetical protein
MNNKVVGYLLLSIGLIAIFFSAFSVYSVFTGKTQPVQLFNSDGISLDLGKLMGGQMPPEQAEQLGNVQNPAQSELIKPELINKPLNLSAHLFLMGFLVNAGFRIASLGNQLLRPIKVKLKESGEVGKKTAE